MAHDLRVQVSSTFPRVPLGKLTLSQGAGAALPSLTITIIGGQP